MSSPKRLRIRVALDSSSAGLARSAFGAAGVLARDRPAELLALLMEDVNLRRFAELPFARVISTVSGKTTPLSERSVARHLDRQASQIREQLEHAAAEWTVQTGLRVRRGDVESELERAAVASDVLLVGLGGVGGASAWRRVSLGRLADEEQCTVVILQPNWHDAQTVLVVAKSREQAASLLQFAKPMEEREGLSLIVLVHDQTQSSSLAPRGVGAVDDSLVLRVKDAALLQERCAEIARAQPTRVVLPARMPKAGFVESLLELHKSSVVLVPEEEAPST